MKFLFFNAVVAVALVYLFTGGDWSFQKLKETVMSEPKPSVAVQRAVKKFTPKPAAKSVAPVVVKPTVSAVVKPVKVKTQSVAVAPEVEKTEPPKMPPPVYVRTVSVKTPMTVSSPESAPTALVPTPPLTATTQRRAEVLSERSFAARVDNVFGVGLAADSSQSATFRLAVDRRRALLQIAEEMELFSVEAALQ